MYPLVRVALMWRLTECVAPLHHPPLGLDVPVWAHQSKDFFGGDTRAHSEMSTPTTQAASTPTASAAANTVVASSATTGSSPASTSVITSTEMTPSSPKRTMSLGEYKKARGNTVYARDELEALFDVGSDADMEDGEEDEEISSSRRDDPIVGSCRPREDDSGASSSKRSRSGSDRPLADAGPLSSPRSGGDWRRLHSVWCCGVAHGSSARPMNAVSKRDPISLRQYCSAESVRTVLVQWHHRR
ncbi:unnamed protein product [Phytophthora fragariaefolia]|uniref:Unnamed protein product n=1 Tax=Phytophthora fragariaefolia TaxID=1490495 RepID=A0A9W7CWY7_9STRA|nr:unnamed protein product [Phytophthora fragariaefolia]